MKKIRKKRPKKDSQAVYSQAIRLQGKKYILFYWIYVSIKTDDKSGRGKQGQKTFMNSWLTETKASIERIKVQNFFPFGTKKIKA